MLYSEHWRKSTRLYSGARAVIARPNAEGVGLDRAMNVIKCDAAMRNRRCCAITWDPPFREAAAVCGEVNWRCKFSVYIFEIVVLYIYKCLTADH